MGLVDMDREFVGSYFHRMVGLDSKWDEELLVADSNSSCYNTLEGWVLVQYDWPLHEKVLFFALVWVSVPSSLCSLVRVFVLV